MIKINVGQIIIKVCKELNQATEKWKPIRSSHEGVALIQEELDELWEAIHINQLDTDSHCKEAIQVAAMAIRFVRDLSDT